MKANLLSQGTYFPSSLCPTTPLKKLRFQTTKTSKIVHKHFICSFKRRSFSGFGEKSLLLGIHRSWSCPGLRSFNPSIHRNCGATQGRPARVFSDLQTGVKKRSETKAEKNGTKDSSKKSRVPTSVLVLEAGKV